MLRLAAFFVSAVFSFAARAEIAGFEQLTDVSISCPDTPVTAIVDKMCSYKNVKCRLMEKGEFVFHGYVAIDCEKPAAGNCPAIEACAKAKLRAELAELARQANDPNDDPLRVDGHDDPLARERAANKKVGP